MASAAAGEVKRRRVCCLKLSEGNQLNCYTGKKNTCCFETALSDDQTGENPACSQRVALSFSLSRRWQNSWWLTEFIHHNIVAARSRAFSSRFLKTGSILRRSASPPRPCAVFPIRRDSLRPAVKRNPSSSPASSVSVCWRPGRCPLARSGPGRVTVHREGERRWVCGGGVAS